MNWPTVIRVLEEQAKISANYIEKWPGDFDRNIGHNAEVHILNALAKAFREGIKNQ